MTRLTWTTRGGSDFRIKLSAAPGGSGDEMQDSMKEKTFGYNSHLAFQNAVNKLIVKHGQAEQKHGPPPPGVLERLLKKQLAELQRKARDSGD